MNIVIFGAAGFIGINLALSLVKRNDVKRIILVDLSDTYFQDNPVKENSKVDIISINYDDDEYNYVLKDADIVFHLVSTTNPTTSNKNISDEIIRNIEITVKILEGCVKNGIKRIIFTSSGGTVYGNAICPIPETEETNPINTYGIQKLAIEKLLYLFYYIYGLDYRIARLSNPYGPYQRPNGRLGAITTFTYKAMKNEAVIVYGDGTIIRDFIYIDDAINALVKISFSECKYKLYNIGSGKGISINDILKKIEMVIGKPIRITYTCQRSVDLEENFLDVCRFKQEFGGVETTSLEKGIKRTFEFLKNYGEKNE